MTGHKPKLGHLLKQAGIASGADIEAVLADPSRLPAGVRLLDAQAFETVCPDGNLVIEDAIVHVHELKVDKANSLRLRNCLIHGNLIVTGRGCDIREIELDHVIVTGQVLLHSLKGANIHLDNLNTRYLTVAKSDLADLRVTSCNVSHFTVEFSTIARMVCTLNTFLFYTYYENQVLSVVFDFEQIDSRHLLATDKQRRHLVEANDLFHFIDNRPPYFAKTSFDGNLLLKTYDFLQNYSKIGSSKTCASHYKYAAAVHLQENAIMRLFMRVVGGFIYPTRFALLGLMIILSFSLFYTSPLASFVIVQPNTPVTGLPILDAIYFSGVTFTTLGFGDIVPIGATRLIAVCEGLFGIVTTSAYIIAFLRKYVDK